MKKIMKPILLVTILYLSLFSATIYAKPDEDGNGNDRIRTDIYEPPTLHSHVMSTDGWVKYESYYNEWNGSAWENESRSLYEYDENGNCILSIGQRYVYSSYYQYYYYSVTSRAIYSYNSSGYLESIITQDNNYGEWENDQKWIYAYNSSGNPTIYESKYWRDGAWKNYWRILYTYNTKRLLTEEVYQNWNTNAWENYYRDTYTYNTSSKKISMIHQSWDDNTWDNSSKEEYTYYSSGYTKQKVDYYWYSGTWINHARNLYTYDSKGNLTEDLIQWLTTDWNDARRYRYSYNSANKMISKSYQTVEDGSWLNNERYQYDYDSNGNQSEETYQTWENDAWLNEIQWLYHNQEFSVPSVSNVNLAPEAPTDQDNLTISATVTDKSADMTVECVYMFSGVSTIVAMTSNGANMYSVDIDALGVNGTFQFYVRAENNIGLKDSTATQSINIAEYVEPTPPAITDINYSPETPTENDTVTISAVVTDNIGLSEVECVYIFNAVTYSGTMIAMNDGTNNYYMDILPLGQTGNLDFYIRAKNTQELKDSTNVSTINIIAGNSDVVPLASDYCLYDAYPNPFNPSTTLEYALPIRSEVTCCIYDIMGNLLKEYSFNQDAGTHSIVWNAADISSGIYLIRFMAEAGDGSTSFIDYQKVMLLK